MPNIAGLSVGDTVRISDFDVDGSSHDLELTWDGTVLRGTRENGNQVIYNYPLDTDIVNGYIDWMAKILPPTE